jgi:DNA-binding response OmpR family regulator
VTHGLPPGAEEVRLLRVMVVDDDRLQQEYIAFLLEDAGHRPAIFGDGEVALRMLAEVAPDLVILDLQLEPMNGLDVLVHLKRRVPQTPVLMLTATTDVAIMTRAFDLGAQAYMTKPYDGDELLDRITTLCGAAG